jgi:hypothetical protein
MGMSVRELLVRMDSRELAEWQAYEKIEPFGEWRADLRSAIVASVVANAFRGKDSRPVSPEDFMPEFDKRQEPQPWQAQRAIFDMMATRSGNE